MRRVSTWSAGSLRSAMRTVASIETQVYSGAKDGWYRAAGGTTYAGLHGGMSFSSFDVIVRVGHPRTTALEQQTVPFYVTVGANVALPY